LTRLKKARFEKKHFAGFISRIMIKKVKIKKNRCGEDFSIFPGVRFAGRTKKYRKIFHTWEIDQFGSSYSVLLLASIEDGLGGIKFGKCLRELLENVFYIISFNFNLGRGFRELLEMILANFILPKKQRTQTQNHET
jgi:hypothetical protein